MLRICVGCGELHVGMLENSVTYCELHKLCNLELTTCCYNLFSALLWIYSMFIFAITQ